MKLFLLLLLLLEFINIIVIIVVKRLVLIMLTWIYIRIKKNRIAIYLVKIEKRRKFILALYIIYTNKIGWQKTKKYGEKMQQNFHLFIQKNGGSGGLFARRKEVG